VDDLIMLSEAHMREIERCFPLSHGIPNVDDRLIVPGIITGIENGLWSRGAPWTYARIIFVRRVRRIARANFVLDALDQVLHDRRPPHRGGFIHYSDRGSQNVSIEYTDHLGEAGIEPSVGSTGGRYENALAAI